MSLQPSADPGRQSRGHWRGVHRALADPLRIRLFEALGREPRSARELGTVVGLAPDRLYYHLRQLERARIVEVGEYRPLPGGKVERVYRRVEAEPPAETASPEETAAFLGSVLDATKADITAAFMAKEDGRHREVHVGRGAIRLTDEGLAALQEQVMAIEERWGAAEGEDGTWVRTVVALIDVEDRPVRPGLEVIAGGGPGP